VDTRDTPEQADLRVAARRLAIDLGPSTVAALSDSTRRSRLASALRNAGWLELRDNDGDGAPLASGVEAGIVAEALGAAVADVAFTGPLLAADLARRAGTAPGDATTIAYASTLTTAATASGVGTAAVAVDCSGDETRALVLVADGGEHRLASVPLGDPLDGADLTRGLRRVVIDGSRADARAEAPGGTRRLSDDDITQWRALGLALTCADLVGVMDGALALTVDYAASRRQYGVPVGSFQAVQHLLAEACTLAEGSRSIARHASWAADALAPRDALDAGQVAKAYCARAARTVCETAIQVHGGIGNTWECLAHVYLRRALLSSQWFGDDAVQLRELAHERLVSA
jgi:alkylation response protein AidB-like acyl-CoA dehydrogenase